MKLESLKAPQFASMPKSEMSKIKGGWWNATGEGYTSDRWFKSDNEWYDERTNKVDFNVVLWQDGTYERIDK